MPEERRVEVDGVSVLVREWGEDGIPVVFWHALGDHSGMQMAQAGPILAREYGLHLIAVDAPGCGGSTPRLPEREYEVEPLTRFIGKLVDRLGLDRPAWAGSSWGGYLGLAFAAAHPDAVRGLALLDAGYWDDPDDPLFAHSLESLREEMRKQPDFRWPDWEAAYAEFRQWTRLQGPELEAYAHSVMREEDGEVVSIMGPDVFAACAYGLMHHDWADAQHRLGQTEVPVLLVLATEHPEETQEKQAQYLGGFLARVPQTELRRINAPHLMLENEPVETARLVGPWVASQA